MSDKGPTTTQNTTGTTNQAATRTGLAAAQPAVAGLAQGVARLTPGLGTVTPGQEEALGNLQAAGGVTQQFQPQAIGLANRLLGGGGFGRGDQIIQDNLATNQGVLTDVVNAPTDPSQDVNLQKLAALNEERVRGGIGSRFAAAGRSPFSPTEVRALGKGITEANLPMFVNQMNQNRQRQLQAAGLLSNVGLAGAAGLDASAGNVNRAGVAGLGVIPGVQAIADAPARRALEVEAIRTGIPLQNLGNAARIAAMLSATGGSTTGTSDTSRTSEQFTEDPNTLLKLGLAGLAGGASLFAPGASGVSQAANIGNFVGGRPLV